MCELLATAIVTTLAMSAASVVLSQTTDKATPIDAGGAIVLPTVDVIASQGGNVAEEVGVNAPNQGLQRAVT